MTVEHSQHHVRQRRSDFLEGRLLQQRYIFLHLLPSSYSRAIVRGGFLLLHHHSIELQTRSLKLSECLKLGHWHWCVEQLMRSQLTILSVGKWYIKENKEQRNSKDINIEYCGAVLLRRRFYPFISCRPCSRTRRPTPSKHRRSRLTLTSNTHAFSFILQSWCDCSETVIVGAVFALDIYIYANR